MTMKLRDLIRSIRACKTAAEERAVITKESALIRSSFKEDSTEFRHRNVAKLLYIWLLGYPAHFGYIECIKLIASSRFNEKRIGYLALMLLLDERQEVLTLVTNSMQMDMAHPNAFVAGLALTALGNIGSAEMARDLASDVDRHLQGENGYTRKKAALCCIRLLRKAPELLETFIPHIVVLLTDKTHHVLLTGVALVTTVVEVEPSYSEKLARLVPALVKILRKLLSPGPAGSTGVHHPSGSGSSEYDIGGVVDPFLQTRIIRLLRVLGKGNATASEAMHAVLAQVATNTETTRNAGNAVLYELVKTIMAVEAEPGLRTLGVSILGRFLSSREPNLKYVALETLTQVVAVDTSAVQRHRGVIVDCLRDADTSISRRALDLVYCLVNSDNVQPLTKELLQYASVADNETKASLCTKIAAAADKYAPNVRWHCDTLIGLLAVAGNFAKKAVVNQAMYLVAHASASEHASLVHKLYTMLAQAVAPSAASESQQALLQVAAWAVGEHGNYLTKAPPAPPVTAATGITATGGAAADGADHHSASGGVASALLGGIGPLGEVRSESEVVRTLDRLLHTYYATPETKGMVLTALLKLAVSRFSDAAAVARARTIIGSYASATDVELQARGVEYTVIVTDSSSAASGGATGTGLDSGARAGLVAPMPLLEEAILRLRAAGTGGATDAASALMGEETAMAVVRGGAGGGATSGGAAGGAGVSGSGGSASVSLAAASGEEDLDDMLGLGSVTATGTGTSGGAASSSSAAVGGAGAKALPTSAAAGGTGKPAASLLDDLSDLLGTGTGSSLATASTKPHDPFAPAPAPIPSIAPTTAKPAAPSATGGASAGTGKKPSSGLDLDDLFSTVASTAGTGDLLSTLGGGSPALGTGTGSLAGTPSTVGSSAPFATPTASATAGSLASAPKSSSTGAAGGLAALDDLFGSAGSATTSSAGRAAALAPSPSPAPVPAATSSTSIAQAAAADDDFGGFEEATPSIALPLRIPAAYSSPFISLSLTCDKPGHDLSSPNTEITAVFTVSTGAPMLSGFVCQVAAAKYLKLQLLPASGTTVGGGASVTQVIRVENSQQGAKPLKLKLRLSFKPAGRDDTVVESPELSSFPPTL